MKAYLASIMLVIAILGTGCIARSGDYLPVSAISRNGFARNAAVARQADGRYVKVWGYVDHANLYRDAAAQEILGERWSGEGPSATSWRFNLMAHVDDRPGQSLPVHVPNDDGRDELLRIFRADADARRPTKVFVTGRLYSFDAPTNIASRTGLLMELGSSESIIVETRQPMATPD